MGWVARFCSSLASTAIQDHVQLSASIDNGSGERSRSCEESRLDGAIGSRTSSLGQGAHAHTLPGGGQNVEEDGLRIKAGRRLEFADVASRHIQAGSTKILECGFDHGRVTRYIEPPDTPRTSLTKVYH